MGCSSSKAEKQGFHDKYRLGNKLGNRGAYGEIYVATPAQKGKNLPVEQQTKCDVKIIDLDLGSKVSKLVENELACWKTIGAHKNIVQLREVIYSDDCARRLCYIVMDPSSSTIIEHFEKVPTLNEVVLGKAFAQMLLGLQFLHENSFVHRDIKPDSFTVCGEQYNKVKLGDFGRSVAKGSDLEGLQGACGAPAYMAPEMILGHCYDEKVDLWSFGTLIYALLFGRLPYNAKDTNERTNRGSCIANDIKSSNEGVKKAISSGEERPTFSPPVNLSCGAVAFAMAMLERDPSKRPSARSGLDKAYMVSIINCERDGEVNLPCLSSNLMRAKQSRAFDVRDNSKGAGLEDLLNKMQLQKLGVPLPSKSPNLLEANPEDLARINIMKAGVKGSGAKAAENVTSPGNDSPSRSRASSDFRSDVALRSRASSDFRSDAPPRSRASSAFSSDAPVKLAACIDV